MDNEKQKIIADKQRRITELTCGLASSASPIGDYKIIKTYEARLVNEPDPYDAAEIAEVVAKRKAARQEINTLQDEIAELERTA